MTLSSKPIRQMPLPDWQTRIGAFLTAIQWPLAVLVIALILLVAAPFWNVPLSRDQGVYATCADTLLRGSAPFRDCWDTKGPALHYTYASARLIFGHTTYGPYALNSLFIAATALIITGLARLWFALDYRFAYAIGLLYGLLATIVRFDMNAQPESFANFFALLSLLLITLRARETSRWGAVIAGGLLAIAAAYKYALALPFGVATLAVITCLPVNATKSRWVILLETLAGTAAVSASFTIYMLLAGAFEDGITHLRFIFLYFPKAQLNPDEYAFRSRPLEQTLLYFGRLPVIFGLAFAGIGIAIRNRRWYGWALGAMILAGIGIVWAQQRFTPYHWTASLPVLSLSIGALIREIVEWRLQTRIGYVVLPALAIALFANIATFWYADQWLIMGDYLTGSEDQEAFFERQGVWDHKIAADYIRERTEPDDKLWVWGHHTAIYYLAERESPTRFIYNEPLLMHIRGGNPWQAEWRAEALQDIYEDPPTYILLTTFDRTFFDFQNPNDSWRDIPEYSGFTRTYYIKEYEFGRFQFWRLKPYWSRHNEPRLLDKVTDQDLIEGFDAATIEAQSDPPLEIIPYTMPGEQAYDTIRMHPDARLTYTLDLPPAPVCLRVDVGMHPDSWSWGGDGATFIVEAAAGSDTPERLLETYITNGVEDQHWHSYLVDLSGYGGQQIQLSLVTGPGPQGNYIGDWAGWALPRIVHPPSGEKCDTNQIVDERE